jgi:glycerol-3-phosphate dehydrogenase
MSANKLIINKDHKVEGAIVLDKKTGKTYNIKAKKTINATGVFSDNIRRQANGNLTEKILLSKGEHISVKMFKNIQKEKQTSKPLIKI